MTSVAKSLIVNNACIYCMWLSLHIHVLYNLCVMWPSLTNQILYHCNVLCDLLWPIRSYTIAMYHVTLSGQSVLIPMLCIMWPSMANQMRYHCYVPCDLLSNQIWYHCYVPYDPLWPIRSDTIGIIMWPYICNHILLCHYMVLYHHITTRIYHLYHNNYLMAAMLI